MRCFSWNVAYRVKKLPQQLKEVILRNTDVIGLQEVTKKTARLWGDGLEEAGYPHIISTFDVVNNPEILKGPRRYGLLMASRWPLNILDQEGLEMPWPERLLSVLVNHPQIDVEFHVAHIPPGSSHSWLKIDTFNGIHDYLAENPYGNPRILCGDFNSPQAETENGQVVTWGQEITAEGEVLTPEDDRWHKGEYSVIKGLEKSGLVDTFRLLNGYQAQEYSFVVKRKGKIVSRRRFDHIFASKRLNPVRCEYLHELRKSGLSDHSAIEADFDLDQ